MPAVLCVCGCDCVCVCVYVSVTVSVSVSVSECMCASVVVQTFHSPAWTSSSNFQWEIRSTAGRKQAWPCWPTASVAKRLCNTCCPASELARAMTDAMPSQTLHGKGKKKRRVVYTSKKLWKEETKDVLHTFHKTFKEEENCCVNSTKISRNKGVVYTSQNFKGW